MKTNFQTLITKLSENHFDFVLIGGFAAAAYGSSFVTQDLDICAILTSENVIKLRNILRELHPEHRLPPNHPSFLEIPEELEGINNLYLKTDAGILDLISHVSGVGDFNELSKRAIVIPLFGHRCKIISIEDLIKSKLTIKRPKDLEVARELELIRKNK